MTPLDRGASFAPSPQAIGLVRDRLQQLGLPVTEGEARNLVEEVLAVEGPRLQAQVRGAFENSLEIIRDTAESALGGTTEKRLERSDQLGGGRRPTTARRPPEDSRPDDDDDPRPVFKRPRR